MFRNGSALLLLILAPAAAFAQPGPPQVITPSHQDVSPPLRDLPPAARHVGDLEAEPVRVIPSRRTPLGPDQVVQSGTSAPALLAPSLTRNFDGVGRGFTGPQGTFTVNSAPPDNNGAVGLSHFVEIVNTEFAVFSKQTNAAVYGPVPVNTVFSGFGGGCEANNDGDPTVVYDRIADRWIISQFSVSNTPYLQCVAVSRTGDPIGQYARYSFAYGNDFPDYPKMGVWPDGYYTTYNMFRNGSTFVGAKVCAFDRAKMLAAAAATQICFDTTTTYGGLLPADFDGSTLPPAGTPNYVIALGATSSTLALWRVSPNFAAATLLVEGPIAITVPNYSEACNGGTCIPQSGGGRLDSLADRLMYRAAYRNFGDHEALVVTHAVTAGTSVGVRWYELRGLATASPSYVQASTYAPDTTYRWMGSAAMDKRGNIALGYSASSNAIAPQIRFTGRLAGDPPNEMTQTEGTIMAGAGAQSATLSRWGDYTSMAIDPADDCTFWYTNQYLKSTGSFNWSTRVASFSLPGCAGTTASPDFALSANPATLSIAQGAERASTVSVTPTGGFSGTVAFDVATLPTGVSASFSPNPTAAGSTTLTLSAATAALAGTYPLTITGTSNSLTHTTPLTLTVSAVPTGSITLTASPASVTFAAGGGGSVAISIYRGGGLTGPVALSAAAVPNKVSVSFSPASPTGDTATMTISSLKPAKPGTYTLKVTGAGGGTSGSATVTVVIQ